MIGRTTLREVREALAAAKARGKKSSAKSPTVNELESLAKVLEREADAGVPAKEPSVEEIAASVAVVDDAGRHGSRRSARPRNRR